MIHRNVFPLRNIPYTILFCTLLFSLMPGNGFAQNFTDFTWQYPQYGGHSLNKVKYVADQTFIAVGDEGMLLMSYDNGQTWEMKQRQTIKNMKAIWVLMRRTFWLPEALIIRDWNFTEPSMVAKPETLLTQTTRLE